MKIEEITYKVEISGSKKTIRLLDKNLSTIHNIILDPAPTNNCQLFLISSFADVLNKFMYDENIIKEIVRRAYTQTGKLIMMVDVQYKYIEIINKLFKGAVMMNSPYKSTNGSNMHIVLIQVNLIR